MIATVNSISGGVAAVVLTDEDWDEDVAANVVLDDGYFWHMTGPDNVRQLERDGAEVAINVALTEFYRIHNEEMRLEEAGV